MFVCFPPLFFFFVFFAFLPKHRHQPYTLWVHITESITVKQRYHDLYVSQFEGTQRSDSKRLKSETHSVADSVPRSECTVNWQLCDGYHIESHLQTGNQWIKCFSLDLDNTHHDSWSGAEDSNNRRHNSTEALVLRHSNMSPPKSAKSAETACSETELCFGVEVEAS